MNHEMVCMTQATDQTKRVCHSPVQFQDKWRALILYSLSAPQATKMMSSFLVAMAHEAKV